MRLLLIEDDLKLSNHLADSLKNYGFTATQASTQEAIRELLLAPLKIDFILMDRLIDGFDMKQLFPELKRLWPSVPTIVISAISTPNERTELIDLGADDYLGKPFSTQELVARMKALLRRSSMPVGNYIRAGNLIIDSLKRIISVGNKTDSLPPREFALLRTLALDPNRIWSKDDLLDYVWGQGADIETNVVESTIANVRKKLVDLQADVSIRNMRNTGYWLAR
jgi:DNA-binding response OmpR family regulator